MLSIEQLTQEALSLPSASRAKLAEELVQSLEFDIDPVIQTTWVNTAKQRRDEIRSGSEGRLLFNTMTLMMFGFGKISSTTPLDAVIFVMSFFVQLSDCDNDEKVNGTATLENVAITAPRDEP